MAESTLFLLHSSGKTRKADVRYGNPALTKKAETDISMMKDVMSMYVSCV
jgi:hypothetical protein